MSPRPGPHRRPCDANRRLRAPSRLGSPATTTAPPLEPAARDYRDLFRRAVRVAVLVFCGWFIAVHAAHRRLPLRQPAVLDADGAAVAHRHGDRQAMGADRPHLAQSRRARSSSPRTAASATIGASTSSRRRTPSATRPTAIRAAPAPSPCRWRRTCSWCTPRATCARSSRSRSPSPSSWRGRSGASSRST